VRIGDHGWFLHGQALLRPVARRNRLTSHICIPMHMGNALLHSIRNVYAAVAELRPLQYGFQSRFAETRCMRFMPTAGSTWSYDLK
jgi:hypothetical protein